MAAVPDDPSYTVYTEDDAPEAGDTVSCTVIGTIETPYKRMEECPNRHNKAEFLPLHHPPYARICARPRRARGGRQGADPVLVPPRPARHGATAGARGRTRCARRRVQPPHPAAPQSYRRAGGRHPRGPRWRNGRGRPRLPRRHAGAGYQADEGVGGQATVGRRLALNLCARLGTLPRHPRQRRPQRAGPPCGLAERQAVERLSNRRPVRLSIRATRRQ